MGRRVTVLILVVALLSAGALAAWAATDYYVIVDGGAAELAAYTAASLLPVGDTAVFLYTTQEDLQSTLDSLTGTSTDNYYIWVCVSSACLPLDPYTVGN